MGELYTAIPIALAILVFVFGTFAFLLPMLFAAAAIPATLAIIWILAHFMELSTYLQNMVALIGLGIAIDYSLLIVYRYREERAKGGTKEDAIARTMDTAGRAVVFSGTAVAIGLALMLAMPLPFMRGFGLGGLVIPMVSIVCALTLLPVLLYLCADGLDRVRVIPKAIAQRRADEENNMWAQACPGDHAPAASLRPRNNRAADRGGDPGLCAAGRPRVEQGDPSGPAERRGLERARGPRSATVRWPRPRSRSTRAAPAACVTPKCARPSGGSCAGSREIRRSPVSRGWTWSRRSSTRPAATSIYRSSGGTSTARRRPWTSPGASEARSSRPRRFPGGVEVFAGGGPPSSVDVIETAYGAFPWLVAAVLVLTYFLLLRAFRSLLLPLKAIILNLLAIGAAYGLLVAVFKYGGGEIAGHPVVRPDRVLDSNLPLRDALRALDGLRGLSRQPDAGGVGPDRTTTSRQ